MRELYQKHKLLLLGLAVLIVAAFAFAYKGKVFAADKGGPQIVSRAEAEQMFPTAPWTAFYVTAFVDTRALTINDYLQGLAGWGAGGRIGGDVQLDRLVFGAFCDGQWDYVSAGGSSANGKEYGCGARAGFLVNPGKSVLVYGLVQPKWIDDGLGSHSHGIAVGGGMDVAITKNWRIGVEYTDVSWADLPSSNRDQTVKAMLTFAFPVSR